MNFLEEIKDPKEREITAQFWADRYRRAPAVMATDMNLDIQGGRLVPPEAGDPGLKMPWLEGEDVQRDSVGVEGSDWKQDFETHLKRLDHQAKQRTGIDALDQQRLKLMYEVERSGFEVWELRDATAQHDPAYKQNAQHRFHRALGDLVELDAQMGHPNADQHRDLVERPATAQEQLAWLYRDGRQPNQDEVTYQNNHGDLSDLRQRVNSADLWQSQPIQPGRFRLDEGVAQSPAKVGERLGEKEMLQQANQARWVQRDGQGLAQEQGPIKAQLSQESVLERLAKRREQQLGRSLQR